MSALSANPWTSPHLEDLPGLIHGFETRLAAEAGLAREEGRLRVAASLNAIGRTLFMHQVHGAEVITAPWVGAPDADAATLAREGLLIAVETADCLPVIIVDPTARIAAVVHAGWRGSAAGVTARTVQALVAAGADRRALRALLGPCIGVCCYEVGEELSRAFGPGSTAFFRPGAGARPHLDLRAVNRSQLMAAGICEGRIGDVAVCTFCHPARLPSYRRDGDGCGRIVSYVGWRRSGRA
jgi:YfiH family protein